MKRTILIVLMLFLSISLSQASEDSSPQAGEVTPMEQGDMIPLDELAKPGRDPREKFEVFSFADDVHSLDDLKEGMKLPGIVTNVTAFGAFVDVGVHQDGLVHISDFRF